jgi:predicted outer membrane repeat protein
MNLKIFFSLILGGILSVNLAAGGEEAVIFCVKPSHPPTTNCSREECQQCNTLQYYLENMNTTINMLENVTLLFLNGTHFINDSIYSVNMIAPLIEMKGESCNVSINGSSCFLSISSMKFSLYSLRIHNVFIFAQDLSYLTNKRSQEMIIQVQNDIKFLYSDTNMIFFENCTFWNSYVTLSGKISTKVKDSTFVNSKLIVQGGRIIFFGINQLIGTKEYDYDQESAITSYLSNITLSGNMLFDNNLAIRGGAIALYYSTLNIAAGAVVTFNNNFAYDKGGAIYIEPGISPLSHYNMLLRDLVVNEATKRSCFYQLLDCSENSTYLLKFVNNSARYGGDDIYGTSIQLSGSICQTSQLNNECNLTINGSSSDLSSVSSDPLRVCLCDDDQGKPMCNRTYEYNNINRNVYPGESFTISAVLVGGDFGTTTGMVYATFFNESLITLMPTSQPITNSSQCVELKYSLHMSNASQIGDNIIIYLTSSFMSKTEASDVLFFRKFCDYLNSNLCSYTSPVFINVTLLDCPVGFSLTGDPPGCGCYRILKDRGVKCNLTDGTGYLFWNSSLWINTTEDRITYTKYCPFDYCTPESNVSGDFDSQCAFNRAGRLCGGCKANYSLAIGSSHCIHCPNNNNLALLIFFAAAGFLLVFFISALNLTVTKGKINGLIFYANVVWIHQSIFISQTSKVNGVLVFLRAFIAWINLDFGIETCFVRGLTAYWKTWLQFVFPLYIWVIALLIIMATKRSSKLTTLLGSRAVPVLNTLFLLSYAKLLRIVATAMEFSTLLEFPPHSIHADSRTIVWSADGNLSYCGFPHVLLFVAGLATLLFLWLPYTLLLFLLQWLRRLSHVKILKWVTRFHPVYDAYFAPLKHKHQYWFGVLLLVRGILLVTFASTFSISNTINLLILLFLGIVLLFYMTLVQPYKNTALFLLQSSFLVNLTFLSGFDIFAYTQPNKLKQILMEVAFGISAGIVFVQFCAIVLYSMVGSRCIRRRKLVDIATENHDSNENAEPMAAVIVDSNSVSLRDSIFEESQKLLK